LGGVKRRIANVFRRWTSTRADDRQAQQHLLDAVARGCRYYLQFDTNRRRKLIQLILERSKVRNPFWLGDSIPPIVDRAAERLVLHPHTRLTPRDWAVVIAYNLGTTNPEATIHAPLHIFGLSKLVRAAIERIDTDLTCLLYIIELDMARMRPILLQMDRMFLEAMKAGFIPGVDTPSPGTTTTMHSVLNTSLNTKNTSLKSSLK
jgi:hypothetical protein